MRSSPALVIGTAGHIDHGKTSLVYALTGIDTDRLKEEKQRGISIDLGFAQMQLADGPRISFVDVPGHERFVRNMLAGAAGMEAVLLIVAADESVMPQTREHFEICRLLGIRHGVIALTKCDLASPGQLAQTKLDVKELVAGSFLEASPVVEVSVVTKAGLPELSRHLASVTTNESHRDANGVMRMPIDRAFAMKGFGAVVTGTLLAGTVRVGDTLEVLPQRIKVRVRGLQAQHASVETAFAGQRLAVNLSGIEQQNLKRGHVLAAAAALETTRLLDVELHWLDNEARPSARELFALHVGTAETNVKITWRKNFARLRLADEVVALPGDRFVIRRLSPAETAGGGVVIDAFPPKRISAAKTVLRLQSLGEATLSKRIELLLDEAPMGRTLPELIQLTGALQSQIQTLIAGNENLYLTADKRAVTQSWIDGKRKLLLAWLSEFHTANPNAAGAPLASARLGLEPTLMSLVTKGFAPIQLQGEAVALSTHEARFSPQEAAALQKMEIVVREAGFQPPPAAEVMASAGIDQKKARALLDTLIKTNRLVKLPDDLIFHADVITHIRTSLAQHKGRKFSVAEFKSWINISRKFAIPLLEYLDQQRITRREGEVRIVL